MCYLFDPALYTSVHDAWEILTLQNRR